jgi:hypothetical protein
METIHKRAWRRSTAISSKSASVQWLCGSTSELPVILPPRQSPQLAATFMAAAVDLRLAIAGESSRMEGVDHGPRLLDYCFLAISARIDFPFDFWGLQGIITCRSRVVAEFDSATTCSRTLNEAAGRNGTRCRIADHRRRARHRHWRAARDRSRPAQCYRSTR